MVSDRQLEGKATGDPSAARGAPYNATREAGPGSQRKQLSTPAAAPQQQEPRGSSRGSRRHCTSSHATTHPAGSLRLHARVCTVRWPSAEGSRVERTAAGRLSLSHVVVSGSQKGYAPGTARNGPGTAAAGALCADGMQRTCIGRRQKNQKYRQRLQGTRANGHKSQRNRASSCTARSGHRATPIASGTRQSWPSFRCGGLLSETAIEAWSGAALAD